MPRRKRKDTPGSAIGFFLVFGIVWMVLVGIFDIVAFGGLIGQFRSQSYVPVDAVVLESRVIEDSDDDGTTYRAAVRYEYEYQGQTYTSDRVRAMDWSSSSSSAHRTVNDHPPGREFTAFVDPGNPGTALMERGVSGTDFFMPLFLVPFNAVGLGIWYFILRTLVHRTVHPRGGLALSRSGRVARLRVGRASPVFAFLGGAGGAGFVSIFIVAFLGGGPDAPAWMTLGAMGLAGVVGLLSAIIVMGRNTNPERDIVIDQDAGVVRLPKRGKRRKEPVEIPLSSIVAVGHASFLDESNTTVNDEKVPHHSPVLVAQDEQGSRTEYRVVNWMDKPRSRKLAGWLAAELHLPFAGETEETEEDIRPETEADATLDTDSRDDGAGWLTEDAAALDTGLVEALGPRRTPATPAEALAAGRAVRKHSGLAGSIGLALFGLFWNGIVGVFLVLVVSTGLKTVQMTGWPEVGAEVTRADIRLGDDGSEPVFDLRYEFGGQTIDTTLSTSDMAFNMSSEAGAREQTEAHPVGSVMTVRVNPDDPTEAYRDPHENWGGLAFILAFLTPFLMIGLGLLLPLVWSVAKLLIPALNRPLALRDRGDRVVVPAKRVSPLIVLGGTAGALGFVGAFVAFGAIFVTGAPGIVGPAYLAIVWLGAVGVALWTALRANTSRDLVIDRMSGRVVLPASEDDDMDDKASDLAHGRRTRSGPINAKGRPTGDDPTTYGVDAIDSVPLGSVRTVELRKAKGTRSSGSSQRRTGKRSTTITHQYAVDAVILERSRPPRRVELRAGSGYQTARAEAVTLAALLGTPEPQFEDEPEPDTLIDLDALRAKRRG